MSRSRDKRPGVASSSRGRRPGRLASALVIGLIAISLTGCTEQQKRGFLPHGVTSLSREIERFWVGTWLWALAVGVAVWGAMFYAMARFRRRKTDTGLPPQIAYNMPLEILFTVVPVIMVAVLFGKTVHLDNKMLDTSQKPDVTINVVSKQWSWDFNYVNEKVYDYGIQANTLSGKPGAEAAIPTLYLPVNKRVEFVLTSRDVIHTFWVISFLQKMDMLPGKVNKFQVTPTEIGTYRGKCAELCGAYHSQMLFNVKVVSQADYDKQIATLKARGQSGFLSNAMARAGSGLERGQQQYLPPGVDNSDIVTEGSK
ncbi:cytochrome c oxidase subunit II [Calidifontibacter sp. DB0510]|uniref:cytochrome-c oxidase n=1 Tax=Metallococcus carri TaxID=1656884 RepID=A0A967B753_9MICO|nr:cytochrome c oxidase subunit II [Metallococcus carri]NOP37582.1 cytochrome c oxidase subunit II [Calidifontibacter sp. DB2511S]